MRRPDTFYHVMCAGAYVTIILLKVSGYGRASALLTLKETPSGHSDGSCVSARSFSCERAQGAMFS